VKEPHALPENARTNWVTAVDFCRNLNFASYDDWRLPNAIELLSLVDYGQWHPALPLDHPFEVGGHNYWTSTTFAENTNQAWIVSLSTGAAEYWKAKDGLWSEADVIPVRKGILSSSHDVYCENNSFGDGFITFTNVNTNLYYRLEYRQTLTNSNEWDSNHSHLINITSLNSTIHVPKSLDYRAVGTTNPVPEIVLWQTGQTNVYHEGDDGYFKQGATFPRPRFLDNGDGTITDNMTGLMWVKEPHALPENARTNWVTAVDFCRNLNFASYDDWRLPNIIELLSLLHYGQSNPALALGNDFINFPTYNNYLRVPSS
jgi:hypothetical protein